MVSKPDRRCRDCEAEGIITLRKAPYPGPRCATHNRQVRNQRKNSSWEKRLWDTYHITPKTYWAIYSAQGGKCFICQRATGRTKRLSVDHDHKCCPGPTSCGKCVRGLLDSQCNRNVLGHLRDDVEALQRAIDYLTTPPASFILPRCFTGGDYQGESMARKVDLPPRRKCHMCNGSGVVYENVDRRKPRNCNQCNGMGWV